MQICEKGSKRPKKRTLYRPGPKNIFAKLFNELKNYILKISAISDKQNISLVSAGIHIMMGRKNNPKTESTINMELHNTTIVKSSLVSQVTVVASSLEFT